MYNHIPQYNKDAVHIHKEWMNEWMMFLLTCDKKLTKSQLSPTHASTKRKITDELKHNIKEGQHAMNQDEGSYQLSHAYDRFLDTASFSRVKIRKNWVPASSDERLWLRSKRQFR